MEHLILHTRVRNLRKEMSANDIDALLITDLLNIRYLTGFSGSRGYLVVSQDSMALFIDSRYTEQAAVECPTVQCRHIDSKWIPPIREVAVEWSVRRLGFEAEYMGYADWRSLSEILNDRDFVPTQGLTEKLRKIKDEFEIAAIRGAIEITDNAWSHISGMIAPGITEARLAAELDYFMRSNGAEKVGFDTIVVSGTRSALVHGKPSDKQIEPGDLVLFDFGATRDGYNGDITRTVCAGEPDTRQSEMYGIVLDAQLKAIEAVKPGILGGDVDRVAREYITSKGYGEYFGHGLGHDLGLAVHDGPALSRDSKVLLQPGMVVTVEPGIYIPGWGGIRIEDDVLVTESGHQILTQSPKSLTL